MKNKPSLIINSQSNLQFRGKPDMKLIGLIGGTGWISTIEYYRIINETIKKKLGGLNSARCILYSVNFQELNELKQRNDNEASVREFFKSISGILVNAGAECVLLCANTAHIHAEKLKKELPIPLIHIADATATEIKRVNITKVGLLGTMQTMELDFYKKRLWDNGIEVIVPKKAEREFINNAIWNELLLGIFKDETKKGFLQIIEKMVSLGIDGVILGCTEIPLIVKQTDIEIPLFNTLQIHAEAAVEFAIA